MYHPIIVTAPLTRDTPGWSPLGRQSLLTITALALGKAWRKLRRSGHLTAAVLRVALRFALTVAGLGFIDEAAWMWHRPAGVLAIGVSLLVLEWLVKREPDPPRRPR